MTNFMIFRAVADLMWEREHKTSFYEIFYSPLSGSSSFVHSHASHKPSSSREPSSNSRLLQLLPANDVTERTRAKSININIIPPKPEISEKFLKFPGKTVQINSKFMYTYL